MLVEQNLIFLKPISLILNMTIAIFPQHKVKSELIKFAFPNLNVVLALTHV